MKADSLNNIASTKKKKIIRRQKIYQTSSTDDKFIDFNEPVINEIGEIADELQTEVYAVGGIVRDYFLGHIGKDLDFTVVGDSISFAEAVAERFNTKAVIYKRFRTALVPLSDLKCEFVGTRKEEYTSDSRNPTVSEGSFYDDLKRRDFTINAMAVSVNKKTYGKLIDVFQGKKDLELKILRTPLDPITTYSDDPLRMLRAARFSAQLDFSIEKKSHDAIKTMAHRIKIISQERISDEFLKILQAAKPSIGIDVLFETGLLEYVFPEIYKLSGIEEQQVESRSFAHKDVLRHSLKVLDNVARQSNNLWLRFAALVHDIAKPVTKRFVENTGWSFHGHEELGARYMEKIFRRMKLPLEHLPYVQKLVRLHQRPMVLVDNGVTDSAIRRLAFQAGDALEDLFILCKADITTNNPNREQKYIRNYEKVWEKVIEVQEKDRLREFQSPVDGLEIMEICNIKPSRLVGILKSKIEDAILDGIIANDYSQSMEYFLAHKDEWLKQYSQNK